MEEEAGLKPKKIPAKVPRSENPELRSFKLTIAYIGTNYFGWQKQAAEGGAATVQEMLEKAARQVLRQKRVILHGSGRTDTVVHARAQVAHLRAEVDLPPETLIKALNAHLPDDIRITKLEAAALEFHAQLSVKAKTYRYFILNVNKGKDPIHWPFLRPYSWFVTYPLDLAAMQKALDLLRGEHDFKSFQNTGTPVEDTVREILEARIVVHNQDPHEAPPWMPNAELGAQLIEIRVRGTGFLKQMVRTIVGTIVEVGRGKIPPEEISRILQSKNRSASGMTAPAYGLFMDRVEY
jgi:tRNA pseudouridine38-40 synthase